VIKGHYMNTRAFLMVVGLISLSACATSHQPRPAPSAVATPAAAKPVAAGATQNPNAPYDPRVAESDKRAKEMGYHVETRHGEQFYCRTTAPIGSRLTEKQCLTAATMAEVAHIADENNVTFQQGHLCQGPNCIVH
jgi:hypothetical protein